MKEEGGVLMKEEICLMSYLRSVDYSMCDQDFPLSMKNSYLMDLKAARAVDRLFVIVSSVSNRLSFCDSIAPKK